MASPRARARLWHQAPAPPRQGCWGTAASPTCCKTHGVPGTARAGAGGARWCGHGTKPRCQGPGVGRQVEALASHGLAPVPGGKPSGPRGSGLGQAFQGSQAPTDLHFVFFKTGRVSVSFHTTFSHFNLRPVQTPQTFSTRIGQGQSFSPAAFGEN